MLREVLHQLGDGLRALALQAVEAVEHLLEGPLGPVVILRVAGAHLAPPVERESYLVQLFAIAVDVVHRRDGRMLSGLNGILLGGQSVGVVAHGVEHVESAQALVAGIDIRCDVAQRVSHVQSRAAGVGEHVEHVVLRPALVFRHLVGLLLHPPFLPFLFNLPEIVFHTGLSILYSY